MNLKGESRYPHLLSPLSIRSVRVRNRIMQTGHGKHFSLRGIDSERSLAYQVERARGGIGLIVTGNRLVHPTSAVPRLSNGYLREAVAADLKITSQVHYYGAAIFAQLNHYGLNAPHEPPDDVRVLWAPTAMKSPRSGEMAKEMDEGEIAEVVQWWGRSAELSREGGFDGVEVHISHSYLLHQFWSPLYNKRDDIYGGSFENRIRFAIEVLDEIRRRVGSDYVVGVRLSGTDLLEGGLTVTDAVAAAQLLEDTERVDFVSITAGGAHTYHAVIPPSDVPSGWLIDTAARVKAGLQRVPVFVVGALSDPAQGEEIIACGSADMVAMTRAQIAEPEFVNKLREGREDEIFHCIRGNQGCVVPAGKGLPIGCTVNPAAGRERRFGSGTLTAAKRSRRWLVVGGGPAGMKAAETLAKRRHQVTLFEREDRLGGQVNLILKTPGRESFAWITKDLERQMRKHGVDIRLGSEATPSLVRDLDAEGVIIATGAFPSRSGFSSVTPLVERLPGVDQEHVVTVWDVLAGNEPVGENVVVLDDDGTRCAAGAIEVLLDRGSRVECVTRFNSLFPFTAHTLDMPLLYKRLLTKGLMFRTNCWARRIVDRAIVTFNLYTEKEDLIADVDTIVLATGSFANDTLYQALKDGRQELHRIGDCVAPRRLDHAIYEGYLAGRELWSTEDRYIVEGDLEQWEDLSPANRVEAGA